jgi:hypothetical protein
MANTTKSTVRSKTSVTENPPKAAVKAARKPRKGTATSEVSQERRREMIAEAAYLRAEQRGFAQGDAQDDWLAAEREVDMLLGGQATSVTQ